MDESAGFKERSTDQAARGLQEADSEARHVADEARSELRSTVDEAREQASHVMDEARSQATDLAGEARDQLRHQADAQTARAAESLRTVGSDLASMADASEHPDSAVTKVTREMAHGVERMAGRLEDRGIDGTLDDVKRYARRHPGTFIVGAATLGFVAGRFLRNADMDAIKGGGNGQGQPRMGSEDRDQFSSMEPTGGITPSASAIGGGVSTPPMTGGDPSSMPGATAPTTAGDPLTEGRYGR
jgi:vacuolar-type H+-ATPase subunit H